MYGNTHEVAEAIAAGLKSLGEITAGSIVETGLVAAAGAGLLVVGGPTHTHGMSRAASLDQSAAVSLKRTRTLE